MGRRAVAMHPDEDPEHLAAMEDRENRERREWLRERELNK